MPRRQVDRHLGHLRRELAAIRWRLCAAGEGDPYRFEAVAGLLRERKRPAADGRVALADLLGLLARFSGVDPDELEDRLMVFDELLDLSDETGEAPDTRRLYERHVAAHMRDDATHAHLLQRPTGVMYDDLKTDREGRPLPQLATRWSRGTRSRTSTACWRACSRTWASRCVRTT